MDKKPTTAKQMIAKARNVYVRMIIKDGAIYAKVTKTEALFLLIGHERSIQVTAHEDEAYLRDATT